MEVNSILKGIEEQKKDENLSTKLFRYTGLVQAIEFFSQKLNFEQIIDAAFDFVNELLTLEKSAIFVSQGNNYVLKKLKGFDSDVVVIKDNENLKNLATLHGALLHDKETLGKFFQKSVIEAYNVTTAIPLIIENMLYGFIFISNKTDGAMNSDDYIISEALMKLFNNALENYKRYEELQTANKELDEKIFNLFAINQSSKALLSELNLEILHNLSVDVFSELTQSSITGFVLHDEKTEKYALKAFKDIFFKETDIRISLTLNKLAKIDANKVIIDLSKKSDIAYFKNIFKEGAECIAPLKALYVVLLIKNGKVLGFVSLGKTVTGQMYKNSMFELIESLASATYIALSNAQLFRQVHAQKKVIQTKLDKLISLNNLMKNINSSSSVETLLEMTLKTLDISFDVEKALLALYDNEKEVFNIANKLNIETKRKEIRTNDNWKRILEGDTIYEAKADGVEKYIGKTVLADISGCAGILIVPVYIERIEVELIGILVVFKYKKTPITDEEQILTLEAISGHIAPVLSNLYTMEEQRKFLLPNHIELFKRDLKKEISQALDLNLDLQVIQINDDRDFLFNENNISKKLRNNYDKVYPLSGNNIFIINSGIEKNIDKKIKRITGLKDIQIRTMVLGEHFKSYQEFFKLF